MEQLPQLQLQILENVAQYVKPGGVLMYSTCTLVYEENGELCFEVTNEENDFFFDEIGSHLKIKELQRTKEELLKSL